VSIYAADMRGLQAQVPGGDATGAPARSPRILRGDGDQSVQSGRRPQGITDDDGRDTGGRAFFDSNSFAAVFDKVVNDTSAYYVLGYSPPIPRATDASAASRSA
jgi:hypothetical protein